MSDELRDRIAESQRRTLARQALVSDVDLPAYLAQAVIDDLGLVEERTVRVVDHGAGEVRIPETRVVGKWERS